MDKKSELFGFLQGILACSKITDDGVFITNNGVQAIIESLKELERLVGE